jgi:hypothetical protein
LPFKSTNNESRYNSLIALKVLVGINLLGYAYKRFASMQAREEKERKKDEEYAEMDKDEKVSSVSIMSTTLNHV